MAHARSRFLPASSNGARSASASSSRPRATSASTSSGTIRKYAGSRTPIACSSSTALERYRCASDGLPEESSRNPRTDRFGTSGRISSAASARRNPSRASSLAASLRPRWASTRPTAKWAIDEKDPMRLPLDGRPALPRVFHGCTPVARPAFQLGEVVLDLGDRALDATRRGSTQELVEGLAGLVQAIGELEELSEDEARTQDVGDEFPRHVPLQGDPAIQHLAIDTPSEEELDEGIRLEGLCHEPWFLKLLGQVQRRASVPFRCFEVSPEQPGVPEVLLDPSPQGDVVSHLVHGSREDVHGPPPTFRSGDDLTEIQQHPGFGRGRRSKGSPLARGRCGPSWCLRTRSEPGPPRGSGAAVPRLGPAGWLGGPSPRARPRTVELPGNRPAGRLPRGRPRRHRPGPRPTGPGGALVPPDHGRSSPAARAAVGAGPAGSSGRRRKPGAGG